MNEKAAGPLLDVQGLCVDYRSSRTAMRRRAPVQILDGLDLVIQRGETLGLVGESGCGKTTLLLSILRLVKPRAGHVMLDGEDVLIASGDALRRLRRDVQVVFQNPFSSLNPRMTVLELVAEPLRLQGRSKRSTRKAAVQKLLDDVNLGDEQLGLRPQQLSGGQAQRVAIARALALHPKLLLLDEPTSALDVSVQAQILNLLKEIQQQYGMTYLLVTHDLRVVRHESDRIAVMYLGEVVEHGSSDQLLANPAHPYTQALLVAGLGEEEAETGLPPRGDVPAFTDPPPGCRFHTRCPYVHDLCRTTPPTPREVDVGHFASCHLAGAEAGGSVPMSNHTADTRQ